MLAVLQAAGSPLSPADVRGRLGGGLLSAHPEDDVSRPLTGVFSTCSPNRPNPIGLHRARIMARDGLRMEGDALEAIDGTPVVDVKPAIGPPG